MECWKRSVDFQTKWQAFMSLQFFEEDQFDQMMSEFDELQRFCASALTYDEVMECHRRTREYQNK
jgi:cell fate (sporulation/competence/biofilm development) regulator YlbF (YheA/YmcA/DUF963 family)